MFFKLIAGLAVGAAVGGVIGSLRTCEDGGCPLTANPRRGALYGAFIGLLFTVVIVSPFGIFTPAPEPSPFVPDVASAAAFQEDILASEGKAVAYFTADWCPACKQFSPVLYEVAEAKSPAIPFRRIDVDAQPGLANTYGVRTIPTTIIFRDGEVLKRFTGAVGKQDLLDSLS